MLGTFIQNLGERFVFILEIYDFLIHFSLDQQIADISFI